ncbi:MAG: hypothetical protein ERJ67_05070 [Aphanocapsa feldmannii 277cV]|uniref:Uncharacterized protein n=1 Tax=Aphanocapsa feldmannii 277cV TaxID=2507553 RepID=A0A524RNQ8_9CHRO|nr:MAG: hypothetical protein ERJ67_05070 [Aphanocapsa feldmannii 277cV]
MSHIPGIRGGGGGRIGGVGGGGRSHQGQPQLPAFCRSQGPSTTVHVSSLRRLHRLLWLVLLAQLSTLLLLIAAALPLRLTPLPVTSRSYLGSASGMAASTSSFTSQQDR